ncbi:MAG TPA: DUF305 domain-containing protein [Sphingobacteriaceae bacterium]
MKKQFLLISLIALIAGLGGCQNQTKTESQSDTTTTTVPSDMGDTHKDTAMHQQSGIFNTMNTMMKDMHQLKMTGNIDHDSGKNEQMKAMAQRILSSQTKELSELEPILARYQNGVKNYDPDEKNEGPGLAMNKNMQQMMAGMDPNSYASVDHEFAAMMKKHHMDGISMSESVVMFSKDAGFKGMMQRSVQEQKKDLTELDQWLSHNKD